MSYELIAAIRAGDVAETARLLDSGADPNWRMQAEGDYGAFLDQTTPLMVAAAAPGSNARVVGLLLERGADLHAVSSGEMSAVWYASGGGTGYPLTDSNLKELEPGHVFHNWGGGDVDRLRLLLDSGGDPNESSDNGRSCVYEACSVGDPERLRLLIERGGKVGPALPPESATAGLSELLDRKMFKFVSDHLTGVEHQLVPLFAAARTGSVECVRLLVEAGFPADYAVGGENAISKSGSVAVTEYLWNLGVRSISSCFGFDAFDDAIESNNLPVLRFLASKSDADTIQRKLLIASGLYMNPGAIRLLVEFGADVNAPDKSYGSPLHYACWQGDGNGGRPRAVTEETVQTLIDLGADPNLEVRAGRPIHEAVHGDWGSPTSLRVLIRNGADVDARDEAGQTALMIAAQSGEVECVRVLLNAGADRAIKDRRGRTALDHAGAHQKTWKRPKWGFLEAGSRKLFGSLGLDYGTIAEESRVDARTVVELLQSGPA